MTISSTKYPLVAWALTITINSLLLTVSFSLLFDVSFLTALIAAFLCCVSLTK